LLKALVTNRTDLTVLWAIKMSYVSYVLQFFIVGPVSAVGKGIGPVIKISFPAVLENKQ
jgi:hypothetical protein